MTSIPMGTNSYERAEGNLPAWVLRNLYAEETPTEGTVLQSRRGLEAWVVDTGVGPVRAILRRDLVDTPNVYSVSGVYLYRNEIALGVITGPGFASLAGNEMGVMMAAGGFLHHSDGTSVDIVPFPDTANVLHVFTGGGRFWFIRAGSGKLYWTDALEIDVEALDFATAESFPDRLLQGLWIDSMAILFGKESIEFWQQTGDADLPLKPLQNMVIEKGIKATGCAVQIGETFAAVTNENTVIYGPQAQVISNVGLNARIALTDTPSLFTFQIDGVEFLALRLDDETQVWNRSSGMWCEFATLGLGNWAAQCHADGLFGSAVDGKILQWSDGYTDALATEGMLERTFRAGFVLNSGGVTIGNVVARVSVGTTSYLSGDYENPALEMRTSRDAGQTWGAWQSSPLGAQGDYSRMVKWRGLGQASAPGFLAEFRTSAPVEFRASAVLINEQWGGR